ncbi:MAG TPA: TIGR03435 family protein [Bryobacteraceae bacterium]|nr:TIGR03435 family protein [Bryobacteraceae bacterium]
MGRILIGAVFGCFGLLGQPGPNPLRFEVASVKSSGSVAGRDGTIDTEPARLVATNATLKRLVFEAWQVPFSQISGPPWLDSNEYDIDAKVEVPASTEQLRLMLRALLIDRFKLVVRSVMKERSVYALVTGEGGPKLDRSRDSKGLGSWRFHGDLSTFASVLAIQLTIPLLDDPATPSLARGAGIPVVNKTRIEGVYDIRVDLKPDPSGDTFTVWQRALQDQLGLKLESQRARVEFLVVDHAEKIPTGN